MKSLFSLSLQSLRIYAHDRIFHSCLIFSVLFLAFAYLLSTLTIIESRKILLDFGLSATSIAGIAVAIYLGLSLVRRELENRTVYTVLSKPIARYSYLLGRFCGGILILAIVHALNGSALASILLLLGENLPEGFLACNILCFLESALVMAAAFLLSIYSSTIFLAASLSIGFFLIGRSVHSLAELSRQAGRENLQTIANITNVIFPSLDRFNIRELIAYGKPYPEQMLGVGFAYSICFCGLFLTLSLLLFRKKDLS